MAQNEQINIDLIINASQSAKTLKDQKQSLKDIREALDNVKQGSGAFELLTDEANRLTASMDTLTLSFEDVYGEGVQPLTTQLGELEDRMYALAIAGQKDSEEFRTLQAEAIKMRKTIIDVDDTVDAFAQKGARLKGFIGIAQGITGAFGVAKGTLALFGNENQKIEKSLQQTAIVIEILSGLEAINTAIKEKNVVITGIQNGIRALAIKLTSQQAVAEAAEAVAAGTATRAQLALNAAMNANPIGLVITGIIALTTAFALFGDESGDTTSEIERFNNALDNTVKAADRGYKEIQALNDVIAETSNATIELDISNIDSILSALESVGDKTEEQYKRILELNKERNTFELKLLKQNQTNRDISITAEINNEKRLLETKKLNQKAAYEFFVLANEDEKVERKKAYDDAVNETKDAYANIRILELKKKESTSLSLVEESKLRTQQNAEIVVLTNKTNEAILKLEEDKRKILLDNITEVLNRNKQASQQLIELKAEEIKDLEKKELELQKIKFQGNQQALIEKAIERELKANDEKFAKLKINEKQYFDNRIKIEENGVKNLTESEKELYDFYSTQNTSRIEAIKQRFKTEKTLTVAETKKLQAELALLNFEYNNEQKKITLDKISAENKLTDEAKKTIADEIENRKKSLELAEKVLAKRNEEIKKYEELKKASTSTQEREDYQNVINDIITKNKVNEESIKIDKQIIEEKRKTLLLNEDLYGEKSIADKKKIDDEKLNVSKKTNDEETKLKKELLLAEEALLLENKNKLLLNESLTAEERLKIEAQYQLDLAKLRKNGLAGQSEFFTSLINSNSNYLDENRKLIEDWAQFASLVFSEVTSLFNQISQNFVDANVSQIELQKQEALRAYDEQTAAYEDMISTMSNAERLKADKDKAIAAERNKIEAEYDEKRREAEYQGALRSWRMSLAQAVVDGASFILKAGAQTGFFGVPAASILSALQIGTILANPPQKFATGGYVSGEGNGTDDKIPAMLSNGEFVINAAATSKNLPLLEMINNGATPATPNVTKLATGGYVNINNNNNIVDNSEIIRIFEQYMSQPIKAYVVGNDVTQQQDKDNRLKSRTSF